MKWQGERETGRDALAVVVGGGREQEREGRSEKGIREDGRKTGGRQGKAASGQCIQRKGWAKTRERVRRAFRGGKAEVRCMYCVGTISITRKRTLIVRAAQSFKHVNIGAYRPKPHTFPPLPSRLALPRTVLPSPPCPASPCPALLRGKCNSKRQPCPTA